MVWRLDRLGRSLPHLSATLTNLAPRGVGCKLSDGGQTNVDTICHTLGIWRATRYRFLDRPAGRHRSMTDSAKELRT